MVGSNTVLSDDPLLTARQVNSSRPLLRLVLDQSMRLPLTSQLVRTAGQTPVWVFANATARQQQPQKLQPLQAAGVHIEILDPDQSPLPQLLHWLWQKHATHLLVEPGPTLARAFLSQGLVDRVWVFESPMEIGQEDAPMAAQVNFPQIAQTNLDGDILREYLNPASAVYFAPTPSADFVLARGAAPKPDRLEAVSEPRRSPACTCGATG